MEVLTEVPQSGTRLRIDADRSFEQQPGDSVLRIHGQSRDGSQVMDATYVEVDSREAQLVGQLVRSLRQPPPELLERTVQEIQAAFPARIGGRDAQQIAQLAWSGYREWVSRTLADGPGAVEQRIEELAERFERASAQRRRQAAFTVGGNGQEQGKERQHR